jgi:hypothetical protein
MESSNTLQFGSASLRVKNILLQEGILLDEASLEGDSIHLDLPATPEDTLRITTGEIQFRASMSEPNLNRMLTQLLPSDAPVRSLSVAIYSGKVEFKGLIVRSVLSLPFTLEAVPVIQNGIRISLDCKAAKASGFGLPPQAVEVVEKVLNEKLSLDLGQSPIPVWLDEIRCEPGRLTILGKGRITWPLPTSSESRPVLTSQTTPALTAR